MFNTLKALWQQGIGLLLPHSCPSCGAYLKAGQALGFCAECYGLLPWWNPAQIIPPQLPKHIDKFRAPLLYEGPAREAILDFKFNDATHLAPLLARLIFPFLPPAAPDVVLVPVPMHPAKMRQRTYNQAALLVQELAKLSGFQADVLTLQKVKHGEAQHNLSRAARLRLPNNTFACAPRAFTGKHVVLVDDIFTTGATLGACAAVLKQAGAVRVEALTLAYTPPGR
jgi:ComF family protein